MNAASLLAGLLVLAASTARALSPPSERVFTIEDSIKLAMLNSGEALAVEQGVTIAEQRVKEAYYLFLPEIGFSASATRLHVDRFFAVDPELGGAILEPGALGNTLPDVSKNLLTGRVYFLQTLYAGGRGINTLKMAKAALKQARSDYDTVRMEVQSDAKKAFYDLLAAQRRLAATQAAAEEARAIPFAAGDGPLDRVEAAAYREQLRARVAAAGKDEGEARMAYLRILNLELNTPVRLKGELAPPEIEVNLAKATVWAMELRPELQSQLFKAQVDAIGVNLALGRKLPTVHVGGAYEGIDDAFPIQNRNWHATLAIRLPISYNFWSQLKQKRAEQRQGELRRSTLQDQVRLEVRVAFDELRHWKTELPRRKEAFQRISGLYRKAGSSRRGARALGARLALLDAELAYVEALRRGQLAAKDLERAVGRELR